MLNAWNAFPILDRLLDNAMFDDVGGNALGTASTPKAFSPAIDVKANDDEIAFVCDVPGLKQEDLDVTVEGSTLTIKGQRRYTGGEKDQVWLGRAYGAFERSFTLPDAADVETMTADLSDGVLTLHLAKKPQAKPRRIAIGGASPKQLGEKKE